MNTMKRTGKKTPHPGIRRDGQDNYLVRVAMRDPTTRRHRERERQIQGTIADAIRAREALRAELKREIEGARRHGVVEKPPVVETLGAYAKRWLLHLKRTGRNREHVLKHHVHMLERFVLPTLGNMDVHEITRADVVGWMEAVGEMKRDGEPYAKRTLATAWGTLRTMLRDALVLCNLDNDPTHAVRFAVRGKEPAHKDVLTQDELARVLDETHAESPDIRAMIWVGFTTGMRFGELSALEWSDVDFESAQLHVRKSQVAGNVGPTKTRSYRVVPLHPTVAQLLRAHRRWQEDRQVRGLKTELVFPSEVGKHRFSGVLTKPLARCAERAQVKKHVTAHTMRRTFNNLARQAAGEIVARAMTGHATAEMTQHYSHVTLEEKSKAIAAALGPLTTEAVGDARWGSTSNEANPNTSPS